VELASRNDEWDKWKLFVYKAAWYDHATVVVKPRAVFRDESFSVRTRLGRMCHLRCASVKAR